MCANESNKDLLNLKCTTIGYISLIFHILILSCAITVLVTTDHNDNTHKVQNYLMNTFLKVKQGEFMDSNQKIILSYVSLAVGILGLVSSTMLVIGYKYKKPCYLVIFISYGPLLSILLLITAIFLLIKLRLRYSLASFCLFGISVSFTIAVNTFYETMVKEGRQNNVPDST